MGRLEDLLVSMGAQGGGANALTDQDLLDEWNAKLKAGEGMEKGTLGLGASLQEKYWRDSLNPLIQKQKQRAQERAQQKIAQEKAALDSQKGRMISQYGDQARMGLARDLAGARSAASSRGLLYSGLRRGAEADLRGQAGGQMAQYRQNVNQSQADKLGQFQGQQAERGMARYGLDAQRNLGAYQDALQQRGQKRAQGAAIGGGLGSLAGALLGG